MATSATRHGITWTFDTDYTVGTYANGDPYVVENTPAAGVQITSISPTPSTGRNGHVANPVRGRTQGFDDRVSAYHTYDDALNIGTSLPYTASAGTSIVGSTSTVASQSFEQIETFAILTVLASAPAANSFRPAPIGGNYSHPWATGDLNYNALADMDSTLITVPAISSSETAFEKAWYEQDLTWTGRYMHTDYQGGNNGYGRDMAISTGTAILQLNLDYSDAAKQTLLIRFVQYGIDIYGMIQNGGQWYDTGGHNPGRLAPLVVAAMTLNDAGMKAEIAGSAQNFSETRQTFHVTQEDVDRAPYYSADGRPRLAYLSADIGKPAWGETHTDNPTRDGNNWDSYYRDICGSVMQAPAIAAYLMAAKTTINHDAFFDYAQRHVYYRQGRYSSPIYYNGYDDGDGYGDGNTSSSTPFSSNETPAFHSDFYLAFENSDPVGSAPDVTPPVVSNTSVIKTDTTASITYDTNEGATSNVEWDTDSGAPYANTDTVSGYRTSHSVPLTGPLSASTTYYYRVVTEDSSGNSTTESEGSFTTDAASSAAATPTFSPVSGNYWETQSVTISGADTPDSIEYTTDGTDPDGDDNTYSTPVSVSDANSSVRLKAVSTKAGFDNSAVGTADYVFSSWNVSESAWKNIVYPAKTTAWTETVYAAVYETASTDAVMGFGLDASNYNNLAVMWRFSEDGLIEARNGSSYTAENSIPWKFNTEYKFELSGVVFGSTYNLTVSESGGSPITVASGYSWRTDWTGSTTVNNFGVYDSLGGEFVVWRNAGDLVIGQVPVIRATSMGVNL